MRFVFSPSGTRSVFGDGAFDALAAEVDALGLQRVTLIAGGSQRHRLEALRRQLGGRVAGMEEEVREHVPRALADAAGARAQALASDGCVVLGGGSAIGLAKAVALQRPWSIVAVPTTFSGSEQTSIWGVTAEGVKRTGRDPAVRAATAVYDPALFATLPPAVAGPSLMNALAHCVEALYAANGSPPVSALAAEGVRCIATALPECVSAGASPAALASACYGAMLGGWVLEAAGTALHHRLCHVLGGAFGTPHAQTHAIVLPYAAAYNLGAAPVAEAALRDALGTPNVAARLRELSLASGAPGSLAQLGLGRADLDTAVRLLLERPFDNPRELDREGIAAMLEAAWLGAAPARR